MSSETDSNIQHGFERARRAYATILDDPESLLRLNYSPRQIHLLAKAKNLLYNVGAEVVRGSDINPMLSDSYHQSTFLDYKFPSWIISGNNEHNVESSVEITNPKRGVYQLRARELMASAIGMLLTKGMYKRGDPDRARLEALSREPGVKESFDVFPLTGEAPYLARICLIDIAQRPMGDVYDLEQLVKLTHAGDRGGILAPKSNRWIIDELAFSMGIQPIFRATWFNEGESYAVELKNPKIGISYEVWQKLEPITDTDGQLVPIARKANYSNLEVQAILAG